MMLAFEKIWIKQCAAARRIKAEYGVEKAVGYLIGEKLLAFMHEAERSPEFARETKPFVTEVKTIFTPDELTHYFATVRRVGTLAQVFDEQTYNFVKTRGMVGSDPAQGAQDAEMIGRIKALLLM